MPMNAPVTAMTGTERTPTSYICGSSRRRFFQCKHQVESQRKVRPAKSEKSPNIAMALLVFRPICSMNEKGIGGG